MSWRRFSLREALCRFVDLGRAIEIEREYAESTYTDPQLAALFARNVGVAYGRARCWLEQAERDEAIDASLERLERNDRELRRSS